jgi:2-dehydro-3-deoxyphosphogluconate aldolase / (4S)-4-hydroxy-2-oxoglutarate aldolase
MHEILERLGKIGIVPVVKIEDAADAIGLGRALLAGDLPVAEITFRTAAAEESIKRLSAELPELLVGAGTVLTVEQADKAIAAGAKFIVTPGFNPKVVDHCLERGVPITPGINSPTQIEMGLERGLGVLKFFPAGASGGLEFLKAIAAPYGGLQFIPTGGIDPANLKDYLAFNRVHAVGGTWIAKEATIAAKKFDEIERLAREAVAISLGFEFAHLGVNEASPAAAAASADRFAKIFSFAAKDGNSSVFSGPSIEIVKQPYLGAHGHIGIATLSLPRAVAYLERKGHKVKPDTMKMKDGKPIAVYLEAEISGFAVHLVQK